MKKYFITGLIILLPLVVTLAVINFVVNLLTTPFLGAFKEILNYFNLLETGFWFIPAEELQLYASKVIILILLFAFVIFLGALTRWFLFKSLLRFWDYLLHKIPFVRSVYKTCQDVISTIFTTDNKSFKQVVLVPFPSHDTRSIGLVTRDDFPQIDSKMPTDLVSVFVPTTPNPTSGFLMMYSRSDLIYLDMRVEEAFKYVISCGMIMTPFNKIEDIRKTQE